MDNRVDLDGISTRLKLIRHKLNLTPNQVCKKTGISTGNLCELENGKYPPSAKTIILLSEMYGVSTDWILKGSTPSPKDNPDSENRQLLPNKELFSFFQKLSKLWSDGDRDIQGWIIVQLRLAFPQIANEIKKHRNNLDDNS